jgi:hypothetical protein
LWVAEMVSLPVRCMGSRGCCLRCRKPSQTLTPSWEGRTEKPPKKKVIAVTEVMEVSVSSSVTTPRGGLRGWRGWGMKLGCVFAGQGGVGVAVDVSGV